MAPIIPTWYLITGRPPQPDLEQERSFKPLKEGGQRERVRDRETEEGEGEGVDGLGG